MVDVKLAMARLGLGAAPPQPDTASQIETVARFRFPVTWTYASGSARDVASEAAPKSAVATSLTLGPFVPVPISREPVVLDTAPPEERLRPASSTMRWEMMVPKMNRPPGRPVATLNAATIPALAAPQLAEPASAPVSKPAYLNAPANSPAAPASALPARASVPSYFTAPSFSLGSADDQFVARHWPKIIYVLTAIAAVGCLVWGLSGPSTSAGHATSSKADAINWSHQAVSPLGRSLNVYEPSRSASDYRMEFSWAPDAAGAGWVFRTRDESNYYGARVNMEKRAASSVLVAEHFIVLAGAESEHLRKVIPFPINPGLVRVHMDAIGPVFKLFLDDSLADSWTDARITSGALGFYGDTDLLPKLLALNVTFINNGVSRTSVVSLP